MVKSYLFGPKLFRMFNGVGSGPKVQNYVPDTFERWGDNTLYWVCSARRMILYASPIIIPIAIRRGWLSLEGGILIGEFIAGVGIVVAMALLFRTIGRVRNPVYSQFQNILSKAQDSFSSENKNLLRNYDFEFFAWPVDFDVASVEGDGSKPKLFLQDTGRKGLTSGPLNLLAYLVTNTFGIRLVYPGSMSLMAAMVEQPLLDGRTKLFMDNKGVRSKLKTRDNNTIDTMYVNQSKKSNGNTLVICCEGNAGFYEIGIMATPIAAGYSVLGWNHPGFSGSTGTPLPRQEALAADSVMQFAIHKLKFKPENIIVTGWSIGGYSATWLAMNYPDIKGLILDATFDELEPLAVPRMPGFMTGVVTQAVRNYINLNIGEQLSKFRGPITVIRRLRDEMITTRNLELWTNRGNNLMLRLLEARFPNLITPETKSAVLAQLSLPLSAIDTRAGGLEESLQKHFKEHGSAFPCQIGKEMSVEQKTNFLLFLVGRLMVDVDTSHCTPLPVSNFEIPWDPTNDFLVYCSHTDSSQL